MKVLSIAGDRVVVLLAGEDTARKYAVLEATIPPGGGPPPHVHSREDEAFQVLEGEITVYLGDRVIVLKKGESVFAPRGIPHRFKNTGATDAIMLEIALPAGCEKFFEAAGQVLPDRNAAPHPMSPADRARMIALAPDYGITILTS